MLLKVNGLPACIDTTTQTWYATVAAPGEGQPLEVRFEATHKDGTAVTALQVDSVVQLDDIVRLDNWQKLHTLTLSEGAGDPATQHYKLVLTPLPLVTLDWNPADYIDRDIPVTAVLRIIDVQGRSDGLTDFSTIVKADYRGASATMFDKKSFGIRTIDSAGEDTDHTLMGIRKDDKWILDAMAVDYSRMRNRVCFDLWNELAHLRDTKMLRNGTVGHYCEVLINGRYGGLYCFSDKVNRKLLGLQKTVGSNASAIARGLLYKCSGANYPAHFLQAADEDYDMNGEQWFDWEMKYPDSLYTAKTWQPLKSLIDYTDGTWQDAAVDEEQFAAHFYPDNAVNYAIYALAFMLLDNMMHNSYLSVADLTADTRFWITPWDMDGSFGRDGGAALIDRVATSDFVFQDSRPFRPWYDNRAPGFFDRLSARWDELRTGPLSVAHVSALIDSCANLFQTSGAWQRERERWDGITNFWTGAPMYLAETPHEETAYMKAWYARNFAHLDQVLGASVDGIAPGPTSGNARPDAIYTLSGIRLPAARWPQQPSGLYIVNGKAVIKP